MALACSLAIEVLQNPLASASRLRLQVCTTILPLLESLLMTYFQHLLTDLFDKHFVRGKNAAQCGILKC